MRHAQKSCVFEYTELNTIFYCVLIIKCFLTGVHNSIFFQVTHFFIDTQNKCNILWMFIYHKSVVRWVTLQEYEFIWLFFSLNPLFFIIKLCCYALKYILHCINLIRMLWVSLLINDNSCYSLIHQINE